MTPARGLSTALIILIGLSTVADLLVAGLRWVLQSVPAEVESGDASGFYLLVTFDLLALAASVVWLVAGITFIVWMFLARGVADAITSAHQHRWSKPWTIVGWFIPFFNVWIPYAVMQDIWRGSDRTDPLVLLQNRPVNRLITWWWLSYLAHLFTYAVFNVQEKQGVSEEVTSMWLTVSTLALVPAAVLVAKVIRQLDDRQFPGTDVTDPNASPAPAA